MATHADTKAAPLPFYGFIHKVLIQLQYKAIRVIFRVKVKIIIIILQDILSKSKGAKRRRGQGLSGRSQMTVTSETGVGVLLNTKYHKSFPDPIRVDSVPNLNQTPPIIS